MLKKSQATMNDSKVIEDEIKTSSNRLNEYAKSNIAKENIIGNLADQTLWKHAIATFKNQDDKWHWSYYEFDSGFKLPDLYIAMIVRGFHTSLAFANKIKSSDSDIIHTMLLAQEKNMLANED